MTRFLLDMLGEMRGALAVQLVLAVVVIGLLPVSLVVDGLGRAWSSYRYHQVLAQTETVCPRGHPVALMDSWQCPSCSLVHTGHAWGHCPHCGVVAHAINCPCGLPITNPLSPVKS